MMLQYGISGSFWYIVGGGIHLIGFSILSVCFKARAPGAKTITTFIRARCYLIANTFFSQLGWCDVEFKYSHSRLQVQQGGPLCFPRLLLLHKLCHLCRTACRRHRSNRLAGERPDAGVFEHAPRRSHRWLHHHWRPWRHFLRVLHQWHLPFCHYSHSSGLLLLL